MRRLVIVAVAVVVVLFVAAQLVLPSYLEHRVEKRLAKQGGSAEVQLAAFPALRLLFAEGSSLRVRAHGMTTAVGPPQGRTFEQLDGFDRVDVQVDDSRAGPFRITRFRLERNGDRPYSASVNGTITASDLSTFAGGTLGGGLGAFLGGMAGGALPFGNQPLPVDLTATVASDAGRPRAESVGGSVAGFPAAPLVEALAAAIGGRI
jgi:hypothetical protein